MHFLKSVYRTAEVLECGEAEQKVERLVSERHGRSIALLKIDGDCGLRSIAARDLDEATADIETADMMRTELREPDSEVTWAGRDFQYAAFRREIAGHEAGQSLQ